MESEGMVRVDKAALNNLALDVLKAGIYTHIPSLTHPNTHTHSGMHLGSAKWKADIGDH